MKYIHYGDTAILTSDDVANALIDYAAALARRGEADIVDVPTFDDAGVPVESRVLIGPSSQIVLEVAPEDELEYEDGVVVAEIRSRQQRLESR